MYNGVPVLEPTVNGRHKILKENWGNSMQLTIRVTPRWWWYCSNPGSFLGIWNCYNGRDQCTIVQLHVTPKECHYYDVTSDYCLDCVNTYPRNSYLFYGETQPWALQIPFLGSMCQNHSWTGLSGIFHACTTSNRVNPWSGCLETICQMPAQSELMLAPADFMVLILRNGLRLLQYLH